MKLAALSALISVSWFGCALAQDPPAGWREPIHAVEGDFDGDGRADRAALLVDDARGEFRLFVRRAATGRYEPADVALAEGMQDIVLSVEPTGTFTTACAKGYGPSCAVGEPREVRTRFAAVGVSSAEASYSIVFWDGAKFATVYLSD